MRFLDALDIAPGCERQWRAGKKLRPWPRRIAGHEPILTERLCIEKHRWREYGQELLVEALGRQRRRVDAQRCEEPAGLRAVRCRRRDRVRTAVAEQEPSADAELIACGVPAEVVVVVEEQDARIVASLLAEEVRGGESTDATTHHDQIIHLARVRDAASLLPERAIPQRVC